MAKAMITPAVIRYGYKNTILEEEVDFDAFDAESTDEELDAAFNNKNINLIQNEIRFHAILFEDHEATTQITKFPVQTGFEISNHAIRKNRRVSISGIFTNTLLEGTDQINYSTNNSKTMFEVLESLVLSAEPTEVITNLGVYNPVVFTKFNTRQKAGLVDSMEFVISGEEVQVAETISKSGPKELVFTVIEGEERQATIDKLTESGIAVDIGSLTEGFDIGGLVDGFDLDGITSLISPDTILSKATGLLGEDFSLSSITSAGNLFDVTYITDAWDGVSDFTYSVFTENLDVFSGLDSIAGDLLDSINIPLIPSLTDLVGGFNGVTNCLLGGTSSVITNEIDNFVDTAMGKLDKSIYGAKQDIIKLGSNDAMQSLLGSGLDCVAAGVSDAFFSGESISVDDTVDELITGIKGIGNIATKSVSGIVGDYATKAVEFIKIESPIVLPLQEEEVKK